MVPLAISGQVLARYFAPLPLYALWRTSPAKQRRRDPALLPSEPRPEGELS